jgi:hypothetical protein
MIPAARCGEHPYRFQVLIPAPGSQKIFWALPKSGFFIQPRIGHLSNHSGTACRVDRAGSFDGTEGGQKAGNRPCAGILEVNRDSGPVRQFGLSPGIQKSALFRSCRPNFGFFVPCISKERPSTTFPQACIWFARRIQMGIPPHSERAAAGKILYSRLSSAAHSVKGKSRRHNPYV